MWHPLTITIGNNSLVATYTPSVTTSSYFEAEHWTYVHYHGDAFVKQGRLAKKTGPAALEEMMQMAVNMFSLA